VPYKEEVPMHLVHETFFEIYKCMEDMYSSLKEVQTRENMYCLYDGCSCNVCKSISRYENLKHDGNFMVEVDHGR